MNKNKVFHIKIIKLKTSITKTRVDLDLVKYQTISLYAVCL